MDPIVKWLGTERMAQLLVPDKKVKVVERNGTLRIRDGDMNPYDFSPVDLLTKWNEEVRTRVPANWGWILAKLQKVRAGIVVNSTVWECDTKSGQMVATGHIYHWNPREKSCSCPAYRKAATNAELLGAMGLSPWCKHLTLLDPLSPHFVNPLKDPHGFISFGLANPITAGFPDKFMDVGGFAVHIYMSMTIGDTVWEYPQTEEGHKLLFDRLVNAHSKGYQIRNLLEVKG